MTGPAPRSVEITLSGLSATFRHERRGNVVAVDDLDLAIQPGELLTLLGPSGCGKTTTLRMIAGFHEPSAGSIRIGGEDMAGLPPNRRDIGVVFQSYALFPHLSVFENVAYGLRVRGAAGPALAAGVDEALDLVGLVGLGDRQIGELSGGQQQRVALARAIVIRPRVLLFDEPLSNLDAKLRIQVREEIAALQRRLGITTVYVTHDQDEAMAISSRIAVMENGRIAQIGTAAELYRHPVSSFVASFLGRANLVAGLVEDVGGGRARLVSPGLTLDIAGPQPVVPEARMQAVLRPESIEVTAEPDLGAVAAEITRVVYLGEKVEYGIALDGHALQAIQSNPASIFEVGQRVHVRFPRQGVQLVPAAPTDAG